MKTYEAISICKQRRLDSSREENLFEIHRVSHLEIETNNCQIFVLSLSKQLTFKCNN